MTGTRRPGDVWREVNSEAWANFSHWWRRGVLFVSAVVAALLLIAVGSGLWARRVVPSSPLGDPSPALAASATPGQAPSDFAGAKLVVEFLSRLRAGDPSYREYLAGAVFVFTPFDETSVGWASRHEDGTASISLLAVSPETWRSLERSLTRAQTILPDTLMVTAVTRDNPDSHRWSFDFTIRTATGSVLRGDALGQGDQVNGSLDRLSYLGSVRRPSLPDATGAPVTSTAGVPGPR